MTALLGSETPEREKEDADLTEIVNQLAILNEQLAKQNRSKKRVWKIVAGLAATFLAFIILFYGAALFFRASNAPIGNIYTTQIHCTIGEESYTYGIKYDAQYRILEAGGSARIADHVEAEQCSDANVLIARIENLMTQWGGTVEKVETMVDGNVAGADSNCGTTYIEGGASQSHHEEDDTNCYIRPIESCESSSEHHEEIDTDCNTNPTESCEPSSEHHEEDGHHK